MRCRMDVGGGRAHLRLTCAVALTAALAAPLVLPGAAQGSPLLPPPRGQSQGEKEAPDPGIKRELKAALLLRDSAKVDAAVAALAQSGGRKAMKSILDYMDKIPATDDSLYWSLVSGAISFIDRPALEELGSYIKKKKAAPVARDILYGLAKNGSPHVIHAARPVLTDAPPDVRLLAATKVSRVRSREAVDALIDLAKEEEKAHPGKPTDLGLVAIEGLQTLTGQALGTSSINWEGWWKVNRDKPLTGKVDAASGGGRTAVDFLKKSPDRIRREAFVGVEQAPLKSVVVLDSQYTKKVKHDYNKDRMQHVLDEMNVPHTVVHREDFAKYDLSTAGVLLMNCTQYLENCVCPTCVPAGATKNRLQSCSNCNQHITFSAKLSADEVKKVTDFVMKGGYLFCEDWVIKEIMDRAFPKFIAAEKKLGEGEVDVMPARGMGTHAYLRGIFEPIFIEVPPGFDDDDSEEPEAKDKGRTVVVKKKEAAEEEPEPLPAPGRLEVKHQWQIDDESYSIRVIDKEKVVTLLTSGKLQGVTGGDGAVAVAFRPQSPILPGQKAPRGSPGVVMCVLSHFGHQASSADEMSIQNLLLNFLIDANAAREDRLPKKLRDKEKEKEEEKAEKDQGAEPEPEKPKTAAGP